MPESGFAIKDLAGFSEPAGKLIEAVRAATGVLYEPRRIRLQARADADAALTRTKNEIEIADLKERAAYRVKVQEERRQENLESIIGEAAKQLPPDVPSHAFDDDWMSEFMNCCQDIRDEQMQQLWSRLLIGEFSNPGKYSVRTLNFVKLLSKNEAEIFANFCSFIWAGEIAVYYKTTGTDVFLASVGLKYAYLLQLETLGLINMSTGLAVTAEKSPMIESYYGKAYKFDFLPHQTKYHLPCISLTSIGKELISLCNAQPSPEYINILAESLKSESNITMSVL